MKQKIIFISLGIGLFFIIQFIIRDYDRIKQLELNRLPEKIGFIENSLEVTLGNNCSVDDFSLHWCDHCSS